LKEPVSSQLSNPSHAALSLADLRGVFLPLPTPFDTDGEVDHHALRSNIRKWNRSGISGYVLLGSTGERVNLDEAEYIQVIEAARAEVPRADVPNGPERPVFIVGAGQQSTRGTINEIKRVAGAVTVDAVLVITPHFYRLAITQQALVDHYRVVADNSPVPVILYSMPALTGVTIEPDTAARLSEHENIIGIKDSSADIAGLAETIRLTRNDFAVLTGNGTVFYEGLRAGACGGILAVACAAPGLCVAMFAAVESGDMDRAALLQATLFPLAAAVTTRFGIGGLKAALEVNGLAGGLPRAPLQAPDQAALDEIRRCLEAADSVLHEMSDSGTATSH
jgi:4-hydroxy-2-oxoglutarate aldolase